MPECQRSFQGRILPSRSDMSPPNVCRSGSNGVLSGVRNDRFPVCACSLSETTRPFWAISLLLISLCEKYRRLPTGSNSFSIPVMWCASSQKSVRPLSRFGLGFGKPWRSTTGGRKGGLSRNGWLVELRLRRLGADLALASRGCPCFASCSTSCCEGLLRKPLQSPSLAAPTASLPLKASQPSDVRWLRWLLLFVLLLLLLLLLLWLALLQLRALLLPLPRLSPDDKSSSPAAPPSRSSMAGDTKNSGCC